MQAAKRWTRGYRSKEKKITFSYLIAGKLPAPQIHTIKRETLFRPTRVGQNRDLFSLVDCVKMLP